MIKWILYSICVIWIVITNTLFKEALGILALTLLLTLTKPKDNKFRKLSLREIRYGKK